MKALLFSGLVLLSGSPAFAGFIEVGASGNLKRVNLDDDVTDTTRSLTGSLSYLFDEMSALELSYTDGQQKTVVTSTTGNGQTSQIDYSMAGLDFILTLGVREAILRPYLKLGVAYILEKRRKTTFEGFPPTVQEEEPAMVPSGGLGFRFLLGKGLSLKAGIDAWTSKSISSDNVKIDYAGRVGLSWMF